MDTRDRVPGVPEVNRETIQAFYNNDMYCCYPHNPAWWGKSCSQPHSGVAIPKRVVDDVRRTMRVIGGDVVTEIQPAAERGSFRDVMQGHNLALQHREGGKRSFVDVRPIAPSPAAPWNDSRESWAPAADAPPTRAAGSQEDPWGPMAQSSPYPQGASSSSSGAGAPSAPRAPTPTDSFECPVCGTRTPRGYVGEHSFGYCMECRGFPWQCWNGWCLAWNSPRHWQCSSCGSQDTYNNASGQWWSASSKRRR